MFEEKTYEGSVVVIDETTLAGWAWNPAEPALQLTIEVRVGEKLVTSFIANKYRIDLENAGKGTGRVAFNENLASYLPPGKSTVSITVKGSTFHLGNSPMVLSRASCDSYPVFDAFDDSFLIIRRTKFGLMFLNTNDWGVDKALIEYGEWATDEVRLFEALIRSGETVYDVGANIGASALPLASIVGSDGNVHCFEPQRYVYLKLCANILLNGVGNITPNRIAVSESINRIVYFPFKNYLKDHISGGEGIQEGSKYGNPVSTTTLDAYRANTNRVAFVKIDVEGHEVAVLRGMHTLLANDRPYVYYENIEQGEFRESYVLLVEHGYTLYWHIARIFDADNFKNSKRDIYQGGGISFNILAAPSPVDLSISNLVAVTGIDEFWPADKFSPTFSRKISLIKENAKSNR
jgi:FkbM family methyltransferase